MGLRTLTLPVPSAKLAVDVMEVILLPCLPAEATMGDEELCRSGAWADSLSLSSLRLLPRLRRASVLEDVDFTVGAINWTCSS